MCHLLVDLFEDLVEDIIKLKGKPGEGEEGDHHHQHLDHLFKRSFGGLVGGWQGVLYLLLVVHQLPISIQLGRAGGPGAPEGYRHPGHPVMGRLMDLGRNTKTKGCKKATITANFEVLLKHLLMNLLMDFRKSAVCTR